MDDPLGDLAELIIGDIEDEIVIDRELIGFLESYYSIAGAEDFKQIINNEGPDALDVFFEMIYFPDTRFQESIEDLLENARFSACDEVDLVSCIADKKCLGTVAFSGSAPVKFPLPEFIIKKYVARLFITGKLPEVFCQTVQNYSYEGFKISCKVMLRNSRIVFNSLNTAFLSLIIKRFGYDTEHIEALFRFALKTAEENTKNRNFKTLLADRRNRFLEQSAAINKLTSTIEKSSVETLMMRGVRLPSQSVESIENTIRMIDRLLPCI